MKKRAPCRALARISRPRVLDKSIGSPWPPLAIIQAPQFLTGTVKADGAGADTVAEIVQKGKRKKLCVIVLLKIVDFQMRCVESKKINPPKRSAAQINNQAVARYACDARLKTGITKVTVLHNFHPQASSWLICLHPSTVFLRLIDVDFDFHDMNSSHSLSNSRTPSPQSMFAPLCIPPLSHCRLSLLRGPSFNRLGVH